MEEIIEMVLIFVVIEAAAIFADLPAFAVALWLENVSRVEKDLAGILVDLLEPVSQLLVPVRVVVQCINRVLDLVHARAIGEPFKKRLQFAGGLLESGILGTNVIDGCNQSTGREILT